eukprot:GSMAST32.ASY1.ANO1.1173.1 assembled CDS
MSKVPSAPSALSLDWSLGVNNDIVDGVHSLCDGSRNALFYVAAHSGVIYDFQNRTQKLLQGHCNVITSACTSQDKRWIATADKGNDSMIVVWDSFTGAPIKTIFNPHEKGVIAMDMSPDAMLLVTLSNDESNETEGTSDETKICLWEWTADRVGPLYRSRVPINDVQTSVLINPSDFQQEIGTFTQSVFLPNDSSVVTATTDGDVVLWDCTTTSPDKARRAVKIIHLSESGILCIYVANNYIVTGCASGAVRFFDLRFRIEGWFEDIKAGPVTSLSFANGIPRLSVSSDPDCFAIQDFICGTKKSLVVCLEAPLCDEVDETRRRGVLLLQGISSSIRGLSTHPRMSHVALSSSNGSVQLWDFESKRLLMIRSFDDSKGEPVSLQYHPRGNYLVQGMADGTLMCLHPTTLENVPNGLFKTGEGAITDIRFSLDGLFMATADTELCVALYYMGEEWIFLGKYKSHSAPITGLEFGISNKGVPFLVSVGEDRHIVEYDIEGSSVRNGLLLAHPRNKVEQRAIPTTCMVYKNPTKDPSDDTSGEDFVLIANNEFKVCTWSTTYEVCRHTSLGPTYVCPLNRMLPIPNGETNGNENSVYQSSKSKYIAYSTLNKVVGIAKLPLDGNGNSTVGLIAHPDEIANISVSYDGRYLLTAGANDRTVNIWKINTNIVDDDDVVIDDNFKSKNIKPSMIPFISQLDGGISGSVYKDLCDYFYYAQLRMQGEKCLNDREITGKITLSEIPNIMRALGYYPSKWECARMCNEIKYSNFVQSGKIETLIDLDCLIKLYVNHRPLFTVDKEAITKAFETLTQGTMELEWKELLSRLKNEGECMSNEEMDACLHALVDKEQPPALVDPKKFATDVLGFEEYVEEHEG